jgi:serpin B
MRKLLILFCMVLSLAGTSSAKDENTVGGITSKQTQLGLKLLQSSRADKNRVVSPLSIHSGLMLARLGAQGETARQLDSLLLPTPYSEQTLEAYASLQSKVLATSDETTVNLANSIWITDQGEFSSEYRAATSKSFKAEARSIDFIQSERARATINTWVSNKTNALISNLLPAGVITRDTRATLVNALYFKSAWANPFRAANTKEEQFWIDPKTSVQVPMMRITETFRYYEDKEWQGVLVSYSPPLYHFLLLVPKRSIPSSDVAKLLSTELLSAASNSTSSPSVKLMLPRFKIRESQDLAESLKALGCVQPFLNSADFSKITTLPVVISAVQHEAVVAVDEKGTEAAAATAVIMMKALAPLNPEQPKEVRADKPFAFAILHGETNAPLFLGVVGDPR